MREPVRGDHLTHATHGASSPDAHASDPHGGLLPVDRWVAGTNAILALLWLPFLAVAPLARWFFVVHLVALALPALLHRLPAVPHPLVRLLREVYPLLWLSSFWTELGLRWPIVRVPANDVAIAAIDRQLFGLHWSEAWMAAMPDHWFSELMHGAYFAYYLLLLGVPLFMLTRRCTVTRRETVLRIAVTYLACFVIYAAFPVRGPFDGPHVPMVAPDAGWFHGILMQIRGAGDSLGTAFPSSHTAGAVTFALILWRFAPRQVAWAGVILAGLIALATVYTRNHFAVDTLAGVSVALVAQLTVVPALMRQRQRPGSWVLGTPRVDTA